MDGIPKPIWDYLTNHGPFAFFMLLLLIAVVFQAKIILEQYKTIAQLHEKRLEETRILTTLVNKFTDTVKVVMEIVQRKP